MIAWILRLMQLAAAITVFGRLATGAKREPPLAPVKRSASSDVSVIIPARNEASRISACLSALPLQALNEVIVVDDESTDDTADIAASFGVKVLRGKSLPPGWVGKPWALQQGFEAATGKWVVFLDADTIPQKELFDALVDRLQSGVHFLTVSPRFLCSSRVEQALHAAMLTTLVYRFLPVGVTITPRPARAIGNGQCMAAERQWLRSAGGFEPAAGHMTDDIALVRALSQRGASVAFLDGSDLLSVRMHSSMSEVWHEWGRSLPMVDVTPTRDRYTDLMTVWLTLAFPAWKVLLRRSNTLDKVLVLLRFTICVALRRSYADKMSSIWLSPLFDLPAAIRLTQATLRPVRRWRGRTYRPAENASR